ncbi:MAG: DNA repair exonuclease [Dehalococcoidia bacterium]|nr:DNA repair exonuclease [Dehalococcoidia bacterium]
MPTVFHTADVHLDAPFTFLGARGQRQRQQVQDTFQLLIDRTISDRCDLLLVAGDLFDSNSPSQRAIDFAIAQFRRLNIPVCILPGTHDCFNQRSVYRRVKFSQHCANVFVFTDGHGEIKEFANLGLSIHARANLTNQSPSSPLEGLSPVGRSRWNIAMAHGSVVIPGVVTSADFPIYPEQIALCNMDYVALGHWHSLGNYSQAKVPAYYSGCPETINFDSTGSGSFIRLMLDDKSQARVVEERIGRRKLADLSIALDGMEALEQVKSMILAGRDPESILTVTLTGMRDIGLTFDANDLVEELTDAFFHIRIVEKSHVKLSDMSASAFHEQTVLGQFVRLMQARIAEASSPEEMTQGEEALQLGVALLQGKGVLG